MVKPMDQRPSRDADEVRLDLCGLKCPLPALKTRAALARLLPRAILVVEATDPMAAIDIPHLVAATGGEMLAQDGEGPILTFRIRKAAEPGGRNRLSRGDRRGRRG